MAIPQLMVQLRGYICDACTDEEFADILFEGGYPFDYAGLPAKLAYKFKVKETVLAAYRKEEARGVLALAEIVAAARANRPEFGQLLVDLRSAVRPAPGGVAKAAPGGPPPELMEALGLYRSGQYDLARLAHDLRSKLRNASYQGVSLAEQYHLSTSDADRLVAVLALEARPDPNYLRWLAERLVAEDSLIGLMAVKALITAALYLDAEGLRNVSLVSQTASYWLDGMVDDEESPTFDIPARKKELLALETLIAVRTLRKKGMMAPEDAEGFLRTMVSAFDRDGFDALCATRIKIPLRLMVNMEDPIEHLVINVFILSREKGWYRDVIRAAYELKPDEPVFESVYKKYAV